MRIRRDTSRRSQRITLNLASMIDVTFLLLIYFLLTTVIVQPEDRLSPLLQTQRDAEAGQVDDLEQQVIEVVRIDGQPAYRLGERVLMNREALIEALHGLPRQAGLFVRVDDRVPVGFAVAAIQIARDAGFEQVTYVPSE